MPGLPVHAHLLLFCLLHRPPCLSHFLRAISLAPFYRGLGVRLFCLRNNERVFFGIFLLSYFTFSLSQVVQPLPGRNEKGQNGVRKVRACVRAFVRGGDARASVTTSRDKPIHGTIDQKPVN